MIYEDGLVSQYMPYKLIWRWLILNGKLSRIEIKPEYEDFYGITMKADHFVNQIDYLKMILEINRHSPYWKIQTEQHHEITLVFYPAFTAFLSFRLLQR